MSAAAATYTTSQDAARAAKQLGRSRVLKVTQSGQTYYLPVDGPPSTAVVASATAGLPASVLSQISLAGVDIRRSIAHGTVSSVPVLLGALLGLYLDRQMPWGRGYGPVLGALVGNAARDAAVAGAAGGGAASAFAAFTAASLPIVPLAAFGWGVDLDDEAPESEGCKARRKIAGAGAAMLVGGLLLKERG